MAERPVSGPSANAYGLPGRSQAQCPVSDTAQGHLRRDYICLGPAVRAKIDALKRSFSDRDRDVFADQALEYIAIYFENSLLEISRRNPGIEQRFRRVDANRFTASVYANGRRAAQCTVWRSGGTGFGEIAYAGTETTESNSYNEALSVDTDGYMQFLKPLGISSFGGGRQSQLTYEGAAEYLWSIFIRPLQAS